MATYSIIGADGKQYGPITAEQLRQWIAEGRANAQTKVLAEGTSEWKLLSDFPELGAAGPSTPPTLPGTAAPLAAAPNQVNGPAIGLIITGALNLVLSLGRAALMAAGVGMNKLQGNLSGSPYEKMILSMTGTMGVILGLIGLIGGAVILAGGIKMRKMENYGLCMAASIVAMIPCVSACCLVGLPIGIWSLVVLSKPEVKAVFR